MKHMRKMNDERGFIALISTLIMSAVLLTLMYSTSAGSFYSRFDSLVSEHKRISLGLSESCANAALLKVAQDYNYAPPPITGEVVSVGPNTCTIRSVTCIDSPCEDPVTHRKRIMIATGAQYPAFGGSWSFVQIQATVQNPAMSTTVLPPSPLPQISLEYWDEVVNSSP